MDLKFKGKIDDASSYGNHYYGFEMIYVKRGNYKFLLFENKLATIGYWISGEELEGCLIMYRRFLKSGDEILVESYKQRSNEYNEDGSISGTPDVTWSIFIE